MKEGTIRPEDVLQFWFAKIEEKSWFVKDEAFDELIRSRFQGIHTQAAQCELFEWRATAQGCLAEIIVLDQFSRNMYRDEAQAFAHDALALVLAQSAIERGLDTELTAKQRSFMYMPFMHSESILLHEHAVELFTELGIASTLDYELKHKDVIEQFGRYPHRNDILGRTSTPAEIEYLSKPGSGF